MIEINLTDLTRSGDKLVAEVSDLGGGCFPSVLYVVNPAGSHRAGDVFSGPRGQYDGEGELQAMVYRSRTNPAELVLFND